MINIDNVPRNIGKFAPVSMWRCNCMKQKIGILLIAFLATVGISEAIAAQHVEEGHITKHTHGPPRSSRIIINDKHSNSRNHTPNWFCDK